MIAQPYQRYERQLGYIDPNPDLRPYDLYGHSPSATGVLYRMRRAHALIRTHMDERARQIARIRYEVRPRCDAPSPAQQQAARMVGEVLGGMRHKPLAVLLAEIDDRVASFGHAVAQLVGRGDHIEVVWIEPYVVRRWETAECGRRLRGVTYDTGTGWQTLTGETLLWFGHQAEEGNFWGSAELRGLLALFAMYEQEVTSHMDQRVLEAGILYTQETSSGTSASAVERVQQWHARTYAGERAPLHLPAGMDLRSVQSTSPAAGHTVPLLQYLDTIVREYMGAMLGSLGISGVGARALGESFAVADRDRLLSHAEGVASMASGQTSPDVRLVRTVASWLGIAPEDDPVIAVAERPSRSTAERPALFAGLVGAGIWPPERVTDEQRRALIEDDLGLPYPTDEDAAGEPSRSPAAVGQALYYPPTEVSRLAAAALEERLTIPPDRRGPSWREDLATARRLADGDGLTVAELDRLRARIDGMAQADEYDVIRRAMLGGDPALVWIEEVLG